MIHGDLEFNNTVELEPAAGGGVYLRRFPKHVRDVLSPLGRMVSQESAGCELRFVTEAQTIRLGVSSLPSPLAPYEMHHQDLFVFKGAFFHSHVRLETGKVNHIHLTDITGEVKKGSAAVLRCFRRTVGSSLSCRIIPSIRPMKGPILCF